VEENLAALTVFTTTYNRAHTLHRGYESLCHQPGVEFEWLVIDAESKDGTQALVEGWQKEAPFPIRFVSMPNRGKHGAINLAATIATSPYLVILDSDDSCLYGALREVLDAWKTLPQGHEGEFGVITFLCRSQSGKVVGTLFPASPFDSTYHEMVIVHGMRGDKWECYRTSVLREFPFPEVLGEAGLPENILLGRIGTRYRTRYINRALRIYHDDGPDSSVVRAVNPRRNAYGRLLSQRDNLTVPRFLVWKNPIKFLGFGVKHARLCGLTRTSLVSALHALRWRLSRFIVVLTWPWGRLVAAVELLAQANASGLGTRL
jgi:glycosyltransferase involved in cell wall biosynthesis